MFENFPYTNFHDLNLDWIIQKILGAYSPDNPPPLGLVLSVNGETGAVVLYKEQNVQLPGIDETSWNFYRLSDGTAEGIKFTKGQPAERIDGSQRYQIYDTGNPPPSVNPPVTSVDGMTGAVKTWANSDYQTITVPANAPANIWDIRRELNNGDKVGIEFEYDSVNQVYKCYLKYTPFGDSPVRAELLTTANIPASGVISVNTKTGIVTLTGEDLAVDSNSQDSIATALSNMNTAIGNKYTKPANGIPASDLAPGVIPDISGKQDKPSVAGTAGQVLGLNNSLNPVWVNQPDTSGLQPAPAIQGSSGQVLGLDSNLNPVWADMPTRKLIYSTTSDGIKTNKQILNEFHSYLESLTEIERVNSRFIMGNNVYTYSGYNSGIHMFSVSFTGILNNTPILGCYSLNISSANSSYKGIFLGSDNVNATQDNDEVVVTAGRDFKLYA